MRTKEEIRKEALNEVSFTVSTLDAVISNLIDRGTEAPSAEEIDNDNSGAGVSALEMEALMNDITAEELLKCKDEAMKSRVLGMVRGHMDAIFKLGCEYGAIDLINKATQ